MSEKTNEKIYQEALDFKALFSTEIGGRVLEALERRFQVRKSSISFGPDGKIDPNLVLALEGERNVVLFIKQRLDLNVEAAKKRPTTAEGVDDEKE